MSQAQGSHAGVTHDAAMMRSSQTRIKERETEQTLTSQDVAELGEGGLYRSISHILVAVRIDFISGIAGCT